MRPKVRSTLSIENTEYIDSLTFAQTDKTSTIKGTFIHGTKPLYTSIILD